MRFVAFLCMILAGFPVWAENESALNLANQLGAAAGAAYACKAGKSLENYEVIASRLLANSVDTAEEERVLDEKYVEAKVEAIRLHEKEHPMPCKEVLKRFNSMKIFNFVVYADGSVKMDDGTMLHPKHPIKPVSENKKK